MKKLYFGNLILKALRFFHKIYFALYIKSTLLFMRCAKAHNRTGLQIAHFLCFYFDYKQKQVDTTYDFVFSLVFKF